MNKLDYCMKATGDCLERLAIKDKRAEPLVRFATDYYNDAKHYYEKDPETALEAVAYAHGFIDAAVMLGLIGIPGYHLNEKP